MQILSEFWGIFISRQMGFSDSSSDNVYFSKE